MADPRFSQSASRLSEDIGDVLSAIRRMIAEDDALSAARERLSASRLAPESFPIRQFTPAAELQPVALSPLVEEADCGDCGGEATFRLPEPEPIDAAETTASFEVIVDQDDAFAEAFDWKQRMRPEIPAITPPAEIAPAMTMCAPESITVEAAAFAETEEAQPPQIIQEGTLPETRPDILNRHLAVFTLPWCEISPSANLDRMPELSAPVIEVTQPQMILPDAVEVDPVPLQAHEELMHEVVRNLVRDELHGALGERFSSNLRAVIRREIAMAIDEHLTLH